MGRRGRPVQDYPERRVYPQDGNSLAVWYGLVTDPARAARISQALTEDVDLLRRADAREKRQLKTFPALDGGDARTSPPARRRAGVELIRREWGYMLNDPLGTASTFPEALRADGCVCSTYTSLSHGWATGPTAALTEYVLGLPPTSPGGATWSFVPHPGDLKFARAG